MSGGVNAGEGGGFGQLFEAFLAGLVADRHAQRAVAEFLEVRIHTQYRRGELRSCACYIMSDGT